MKSSTAHPVYIDLSARELERINRRATELSREENYLPFKQMDPLILKKTYERLVRRKK